jgi:hypothetical protein
VSSPLEVRTIGPNTYRLVIDAIRVPGATVGQTLVCVSGPGGVLEFRPGAGGGGGGGGGGIPPGTFFPETITLPIVGGDLEPQPGDPWFVVGAISFVPTAHTIPGAASTTFSFTGIGQTTRLGLYGDLDLYDLANTTSLGTMSLEGPGWYGGAVVVTPTTPTTLLLRARARPVGAAAPGDFFNLRGATLGITNTF